MVDHTSSFDNEKRPMDDKMMNQKIKMILTTIIIVTALVVIFDSISLHAVNNVGKDTVLTENLKSESQEENISICHCVAFRLDDIQGYWLNDVQIAVMEVFHSQNIPLTIGVIGGDSSQIEQDSKILEFVQDKSDENPSLIEIANHGWEHEDFTKISPEYQTELIRKTNQKIMEMFGIFPKVFIPPFNKFDENTIDALKENDMTHFSSSVETTGISFESRDIGIHHFPETATTGKMISENGIFKKIPNQETIEAVKLSMKERGFAVIMMHPQEFSTLENSTYINKVNQEHVEDLNELVDEIEGMGLKIVFLSKINENFSNGTEANESNASQDDSHLLHAAIMTTILILTVLIIIAWDKKRIKKRLTDKCIKRGHIWRFNPVKGYQYGPDYYQCRRCTEKRS